MERNRVSRVLVAFLLVTWPHFSDPPMENEVGEEPTAVCCVVSTQQKVAGIHSIFLTCTLLLRFLVDLFVFSLVVYLGVILFVLVIACFCNRQLLYYFNGRTYAFNAKWPLILLLLLAQAARLPFSRDQPLSLLEASNATRDYVAAVQRTFPDGIPPFHGSWFSVKRKCRSDWRNLAHPRVKRMLLVSCGSVER